MNKPNKTTQMATTGAKRKPSPPQKDAEQLAKEAADKLAKEQALFKANRVKVGKLLELNKNEISKALPKFITIDKMIRVVLTTMNRQPDLMNCTQNSLISCIMTAGQLGLMPDNVLGESYLIPFRKFKGRPNEYWECQIIIGYKGLVSLARRAGATCEARPVYRWELFECEFGLNEKLIHRKDVLKPGEKRGNYRDDNNIVGFYSIVRFQDGSYVFDYMLKEEVEEARDESKNYMYAEDKTQTVWGQYFKEMGQKTVLRRLMKFVPLSAEIQQAISLDEQGDAGKQKTSLLFLDDMPKTIAEEVVAEIITDRQAEAQERREGDQEGAREKADNAIEALRAKLGGDPEIVQPK